MAASDDLNMQRADMKSQLSGSASTAAASGAKSAASSGAGFGSILSSVTDFAKNIIGGEVSSQLSADDVSKARNHYQAEIFDVLFGGESRLKYVQKRFSYGWIILAALVVFVIYDERKNK